MARAYGQSRRAMIFWGMGISQHVHGTDNARCLIALSMMTVILGVQVQDCTRCGVRTMYRVHLMPV
ncbi:MAG: hypothetical protein Ct9H300mP14_16030 [Gammaproteobacteria bacterium]|nr:MAG: hypothetical protein Ct9H300mP14_16030 [Gammaproteobacteria bacterium]